MTPGTTCSLHSWGTSKENATCPYCKKQELERVLYKNALISLHDAKDVTEHYAWSVRIFRDLDKKLADAKIKPLEYNP